MKAIFGLIYFMLIAHGRVSQILGILDLATRDRVLALYTDMNICRWRNDWKYFVKLTPRGNPSKPRYPVVFAVHNLPELV